VHLRRTDSTNSRARELAMAGGPHGTLVSAGEQTAGRGRQGRRWSAPAGSAVLMSVLVRDPPPLLPLLAAVAVCDVVGEHAHIKWPNDVVVQVGGAGTAGGTAADKEAAAGKAAAGKAAAGEAAVGEAAAGKAAAGKAAAGKAAAGVAPDGDPDTPLAKLAGILVEGRPQDGWAVLGIGLNVAVSLDELPAELHAGSEGRLPAATLGLSTADVEPMLAALTQALSRRLVEAPETTLAAWRARDALRGREIVWLDGRGRAEGIDGTGRLVVALAGGGRTTLGAGEVHLLEVGERR
jgi:BirA family biotin operon repressor/biotin-[acetyl-CoA-carboxylase] ligase